MYRREKPYYTLNDWCMEHCGEKLYKIALNAGLSCPNRDGTLGRRGCLFCSNGGSGEFAVPIASEPNSVRSHMNKNHLGGAYFMHPSPSIRQQLEQGKALLSSKKTGKRYIAYFQAYTNTYGPVAYLEEIFTAALTEPDIAGISIATRPDCLPDEVLFLLAGLRERFPDKFIWVELGLQTIHEGTAQFIRRGYPLSCFDEAVCRLYSAGFPIIVHVILGLPGESREDMLATIRHLNRCRIFGIKLQLLHVLRGTDLADLYLAGAFDVLSQEAYLQILTDCIAALSSDIVIHRVTGDGPGHLLLAPDWSRDKRRVLNALHHKMKLESIRQGQKCEENPLP